MTKLGCKILHFKVVQYTKNQDADPTIKIDEQGFCYDAEYRVAKITYSAL